MTINLADNDPRVSYSVAAGVTQSSFTVSFEFFDNDDLNVYVDGTLKTLTTDYTVTGGDGSTGTVTMDVTGASGGSTVVITRSIDLERTTDFPVSGSFNIASLNTELDRFVAINADLNDQISRSLKLTDYDADATLTLPDLDTRKGTVLAFNSTTGDLESGPTTANVNQLADVTDDIATLADIEDGTEATDTIQTVAGISSNVTTVAGISSNVTTVAGISSDVTAVAGDATDIGTVSGSITNVNTVATNIADVNTAATNITDIQNASTNASTATTKAAEASTSATNAATSETNAATSATNAATSATAAAASQTAAAASAASAATAYDTFDDRYLGSKTADPTLDNDSNALVQGALYFNSTANEMRVYDGANWIAASSAGGVSMLEYLYIATASQTAFSGTDENSNTLSYTVDNLIVIVNGVVLEPSVDYTATDGLTVTLTDAASLNDEIHIIAFKSFTTADMVSATNGGTFAGDVTFTGAFTSQGIDDNATSTAITIDSSGQVGIGGSPSHLLDVSADGGGSSESILLQNTGTASGDAAVLRIATNNTANGYIFFGDPEDSNAGEIRYNHSSDWMSFDTNGGERVRIDSSGRVGIADTDPQGFLHINGSGSTGPGIYLENFGASEGDITFNTSEILQIGTWNTSTDTFNERFTLHNNGDVNFFRTAAFEIGRNEAADTYDSGERGVTVYAGASNNNAILFARDTADGSPCYRHIIGGTTRAEIEANGDFLSATNSYAATSDQTLKENIVASGSQWDDLKAVQVKKFSYIADDLNEANMIGVIAQDLEASGMNGLVSSTDNGDGTIVKTVKYSVLYMKAIKALQEAMSRIETLETEMTSVKARLDALEAN